MSDRLLQIGEVAERAGLSLRTVRYYEETGLLEPARRTDGGFRLYTVEHVERLALIRRMKPLGFSVQQMRELLDVRDVMQDPASDDDVREVARVRLSEFAAMAATASEELREKLARGDALVEQLRGESRRPGVSAVGD